MDDMRAFEQRVGAEVNRAMGPSEPVDDLAIFDEITAATRSPKWRFPSLFSAAKFVVAGAIVALFGAFLLAGVLTGVRDQEGVPPAGASPSASPSGSILSRMDLETEEVAPGVFRVLGDGHRRLDEKVDTVAITPEGDVWVLTYSGQGESIRIVRAGEPEVAYQNDDAAGPAGLGLGRLVTGDGGAIGYAQGTYEVPAVLDGREWVAHDGSRYDNCVRFFGSVAADGACFEFEDYSHGLTRQDDGEGSRSPVPLRLRPEFNASSPQDVGFGQPVSEDGIVWFPAFSPTDQGTAFGGLARYDGESWATFPYSEDGPQISGPLAVTPGGVVWIPTYEDGEGLTMVSWDGETWRSYGPLAVPQGVIDAHVRQDGSITFGVMAAFDGTSLRRLDLPDEVVRGMNGPLTYAPDGSAWVVKGDGLYVITPEALVATEPVPAEVAEAAEATDPRATTSDLPPGQSTQPPPDEALAVGATASPRATTTPSSRMSTDDLLAAMVTETIGPGVYEVMDDGAGHDFREYELRRATFESVHVGPAGAVYVVAKDEGRETRNSTDTGSEPPGFWRVGTPGAYGRGDAGYPDAQHLKITPDGTVWAWSNYGLGSFDGENWTDLSPGPYDYGEHGYMSESYQAFHVQPDGTVWLQALDTGYAVSRLDDSGWTHYADAGGLDAIEDGGIEGTAWQIEADGNGDVWVATHGSGPSIYRFTDGTWERHVPVEGSSADYFELRSGADGSLWALTPDGYLARHDADGWTSWFTDLVPPDEEITAWVVGRDGTAWFVRGGSGLISFDGRTWTEHFEPDRVDLMKVAPDGSIWTAVDRDMTAFDGQRWTRIALPQVVQDFDIGPDGSVWAISGTQHLYLITPEALAATE